MISLPQALHPTGEEKFLLSNGEAVQLPKATPRFPAWTGPVPFDRYGGKTVLDFNGEPVFAEIMILRLLEAEGWSGVWVDTYRHCFRKIPGEKADLPAEKLQLFAQIQEEAGKKSGCFDVFAWKGTMTLFAESKRRGRDRFRPEQIHWLEAALRVGLPVESFLVVEWDLLAAAPEDRLLG